MANVLSDKLYSSGIQITFKTVEHVLFSENINYQVEFAILAQSFLPIIFMNS